MFYNMLTINSKPGKRMASFGYMREVAEWMATEKNVPAMGFTNIAGPIYQVHLISLYESMRNFDQMNSEYLQNEWFTDWFKRAGKAVRWKTLSSRLGRVFRRTEMEVDVQLLAIYSMILTPGRRYPGVDHLGKLAEHLENTYNLPAEVIADEVGNSYRHYLSLSFDNLDSYDNFLPALMKDEAYGNWFGEAVEFMDPTTMDVELMRRV